MEHAGLLSNAYGALGGGKAALAVLVALIALAGALAGAITSYVVAGRTVYINSITAERSRWIEKLRNNIANYSALISEESLLMKKHNRLPSPAEAAAEKALDVLNRVNNVASVIQLQLNPWGEIDRNILAIIDSIVVRGSTEIDLLDRADKLLIGHSQWLLKAEWEKVKYEAHGLWYRIANFWRAPVRLRAYRKWAKGAGNLTSILAEFEKERLKPVGG